MHFGKNKRIFFPLSTGEASMAGQHAVFAYFFRRGLYQPAGTSVRPRHNCLRLGLKKKKDSGDYSSLGLSALELLALEIFQKLPVLLP